MKQKTKLMLELNKVQKGICELNFFDFLIKSGVTEIKANTEEKNRTKGIEIHPNQKPITASNLASPSPIPSFF